MVTLKSMKSRGNDVRLVVVAAFWTALGITALLFAAVRVLGDDHRPVKVPQPVLEWVGAAGCTDGEQTLWPKFVCVDGHWRKPVADWSTDGSTPKKLKGGTPMIMPTHDANTPAVPAFRWSTTSAASTGAMVAQISAGYPKVLALIESGKTVAEFAIGNAVLHVQWIDSDWCEREYGHVWVDDSATVLTDDLLFRPYGSSDPCAGRNYTEHYTCKICKLKKMVKHTCKADDEQTTYEKPGVKKP